MTIDLPQYTDEEGSEICADCRMTFEGDAEQNENPVCGKCGTYESECGCRY